MSEYKSKKDFHKLNRILTILIVALFIVYVGLQMVVTSMVGTKSEEIDNVRAQKAELRLENEILTSKIDGARSLDNAKDLQEKSNLETKNVNFLEKADGSNVALN
ncbi:hypothetical protein DOJK_01755 [Patescibacteria group bacterium]|nr:hypothetical protein DOJK_01755 [Patescibacteria group bacterium]